jgi:hypothetical protein
MYVKRKEQIDSMVGGFYLNEFMFALKKKYIYANFEVIGLVLGGFEPTSVNTLRLTDIHGSKVPYKSPTMSFTDERKCTN